MIEGLITGKVCGRPERRIGSGGKPLVTAKARAAAGAGDAVFVNVLAFSDSAQAALLALGDGDAVALAGTLTPKAWTDREGQARPALDLVAAQVLTTYGLKRKREVVAAAAGAGEQRLQPARQGHQHQHQQDHGAGDFGPKDDAWLHGGKA